MTRLKESSELRNPMPDMTDAGLRVYCAVLERRLLLLTVRDIRLRSVCEIATGQPYDSFDPRDMSYEELMEHVAQDMARGLSISIEDARDRVARNSQTANPSQMEVPYQG
jgi:hypothetical protein